MCCFSLYPTNVNSIRTGIPLFFMFIDEPQEQCMAYTRYTINRHWINEFYIKSHAIKEIKEMWVNETEMGLGVEICYFACLAKASFEEATFELRSKWWKRGNKTKHQGQKAQCWVWIFEKQKEGQCSLNSRDEVSEREREMKSELSVRDQSFRPW